MSEALSPTFTAFAGDRLLATGPLAEVAIAVKIASGNIADPVLIFDDATGHSLDLDLRGSHRDIVARLPQPPAAVTVAPAEPRGRGRPKLGVVAREVTLLPRHWEWLGSQPGGASVTLRRLVDEARKAGEGRVGVRAARENAYRFMSEMAGDLAGFEEASRALFAGDRPKFESLVAPWPEDVRLQLARLAADSWSAA